VNADIRKAEEMANMQICSPREKHERGAHVRLAIFSLAALVAACAGRSSESLQEARGAVASARGDPEVVARAPEELLESERALERAESAFGGGADQDEVDHLAYVAGQRAAIAQTIADERVALVDIEGLNEELEDELAGLPTRQTDRGLVVTLGEEILFDVDQAELKPGGAQQLARVADFLLNHPDRGVVVEGHTDSTASDSYNLALSQRRANAVEDFLISQGVDPTRIGARGYGEQLPVATNDTAAGRQENRRVELLVLDPGEGLPGPRLAVQ
jgi:OmpA-OmpF porin, OOP family